MLKNQCDGCNLGYPIVNGLHMDINCKPYMACTKSKYNLDSVEFDTLQAIANDEGSVSSSEHKIRCKLQALGYCTYTTNHGEFSFNDKEIEYYWDLTSLGATKLDNRNKQ